MRPLQEYGSLSPFLRGMENRPDSSSPPSFPQNILLNSNTKVSPWDPAPSQGVAQSQGLPVWDKRPLRSEGSGGVRSGEAGEERIKRGPRTPGLPLPQSCLVQDGGGWASRLEAQTGVNASVSRLCSKCFIQNRSNLISQKTFES